MTSHAETGSLSRAFYFVAAIVIGLPLIYFLGVGPAVVVVVKVPSLRQPIHAVYYPMIWLHDHTSLGKPMNAYLGYWEKAARSF